MSGSKTRAILFVPPFPRVGLVGTEEVTGQQFNALAMQFNQAMAQIERALAFVQGLALGAIYAEITISNNAVVTALPTQNAWVQVTAGWSLGDDFAGMTAALTGAITSATVGNYPFATIGSASLQVGTGGAVYQFGIFKNGALVTEHMAELTVGAGEEAAVTLSGIDRAALGDVFTLRARCTSAAATSVTVTQANLSMWSIAATGNQL